MLVLSRRQGEKINIGDNIMLTIVRIGPNSVRLGIDAPRDMDIVREELDQRIIEVVADQICEPLDPNHVRIA